VFDSSLGLNTISLGLRDESENTLHISLFTSGALDGEAFSRYTGGKGLDNILNYGPRKAYSLPDLAIAFPLPAEGADGSTNGSFLVLIRLVLYKNVRREDI
jgi:hypothetical protein